MGIIRYSKVPVLENLSLLSDSCLIHTIFKSLFQFYKIFYCCCHVRSLKGAPNSMGSITWKELHIIYFSSYSASGKLPWTLARHYCQKTHKKPVFKLTLNLSHCTDSKDTIMCEEPVHFQKFLGGERNSVSGMLLHRKETLKTW